MMGAGCQIKQTHASSITLAKYELEGRQNIGHQASKLLNRKMEQEGARVLRI